MRELAALLTEVLGSQFNKEINRFVNEQFSRTSDVPGGTVTLNDVNHKCLARTFKSCVLQLGLSAEDVFKYMMIIPYVSVRCEVEAIIEFKSSIYEGLFNKTATLIVGLISDTDEIKFAGKQNHVKVKPNKKANGPHKIVGGYINVNLLDDNTQFSVLIDSEEWTESMRQYHVKKYNKCDISDQQLWEEIGRGLLFRRLIDEEGGMILSDQEPERYLRYREILDYGLDLFNEKSDSGKTVYSEFGAPIGKTFRKFNAPELIEAAKSKHSGHLTMVVNNTAKRENEKFSSQLGSNNDEVITEWGEF
jgi:hypothetical protein